MKELIDLLKEASIDYRENEPLNRHCSFKIGGPGKLLLLPKNIEEIQILVRALEGTSFLVLGNGSNVLFRDGGYDGVIMKLAQNFSSYRIEEDRISASSGVSLSVISRKAALEGLSGLEFASGIPGTLGGGVIMNAGAYDGELKDVVTGVTLMDKKGNIFKMSGEEMDFSYRDSLAQRMNYIVLEVELQLQKSDYDKIWQKIDDFSIRRWSKQPLEFPSGGSTFKRPQGYYAGKLIQDAGLKGLRFRGAQVSPKHSGFIINVDNASCEDVRTLIRLVQKRVKDEYGIELEAELRLINDEIKG
ncbi:MAG: UDP-N-acetylmuramate dehydrogenase [Tissierellia bacterium]|nr:UDP-N-acetylmuramate dehydrogenase [Tissierellia bacterium]